MMRSPLRCRTSIIRSSAFVQASSSLSMGRTRAWPRSSLITEIYIRHFSREFLSKSWTLETRHPNRAAEQASIHTHAFAKSKHITLWYTWQYESLCSVMRVWLCFACDLRPTNHDLVYDVLRIGGRIRGCASAVLRVCNMIELVHAALTLTYAAARRLSGMSVGCATLSFSVFRICSSLLKKGGMLHSPDNLQSWQIAQPLLREYNLSS